MAGDEPTRSRPDGVAIAVALGCGKSGCRCARTTRTGKGLTHCPAHSDQTPSLSVSERDGKVLVNCRAGCAQDAVLATLRDASLWPRRPDTQPAQETVYRYRDGDGALLFEVVRRAGKRFLQRRPPGPGEQSGGDGWVYNLDGVRRAPYRLLELVAADLDAWVFIPEGERDVETLRALGLTATTNLGGAGKWRDEYSLHLADRRVAVLPDNDRAGGDHAQQVARSVNPHAAVTKVVELAGLPEKGDVSDWLAEGHTREELSIWSWWVVKG